MPGLATICCGIGIAAHAIVKAYGLPTKRLARPILTLSLLVATLLLAASVHFGPTLHPVGNNLPTADKDLLTQPAPTARVELTTAGPSR